MRNTGPRDRGKASLPPWLRRLDVYEVEENHERFWRVCEIRRAPSANDLCREVVWPKQDVGARVIPGGIIPLDAEVGFDHDARLEQFFTKHSPDGIIAWNLEGAHYGTFAGPYNNDFRSWLAVNLVFGTICGISPSANIVLVAEGDFEYSVIGAPPGVIGDLDLAFGGENALKAVFTHHLELGDMGADPADKEWGRNYLMQWCGW